MTEALPDSIECLLEDLEHPHSVGDQEATILAWTNVLGVDNKCVRCRGTTIDPWAFSEATMEHYEVAEDDVEETQNRIHGALGGWGVSTNGPMCDYCENLMEKDKPLLDLSPLERAITQLEEALDFAGSELAKSDPRLSLHLRAAAIQAFEFTYELSYKLVKRHLGKVSENPAQFDGGGEVFNYVIREAWRRGLVQSELQAWREYRRSRGTTSHTYNEEKAQEVFDAIPGFLQDARYLLSQLQERN